MYILDCAWAQIRLITSILLVQFQPVLCNFLFYLSNSSFLAFLKIFCPSTHLYYIFFLVLPFYFIIVFFFLVFLTNTYSVFVSSFRAFTSSIFSYSTAPNTIYLFLFPSFTVFLFLSFESGSFWDSHLLITGNRLNTISFLLLYSSFFYYFISLFFSNSRFVLEFNSVIYMFIYWFSSLFLTNNLFSFIFLLELLSISTFVLIYCSFFCTHNFMQSFALRLHCGSSKVFSNFAPLLVFFWTSSLLSIFIVLILVFSFYYFNYTNFFILQLFISFLSYIEGGGRLGLLAFFFFAIFLFFFIKLGLPPFIIWKFQVFAATPFFFNLFYFLFYTIFLVLIIFNFLIFFSINDLYVFKAVLFFFIFLFTFTFYFLLFSLNVVRFFIVLSSSLTSFFFIYILLLSSLETNFFIYVSARLYFFIYVICSFFLFALVFVRYGLRTSHAAHLVFMLPFTRNFFVFFLLVLVGLPPFFSFFLKFIFFSYLLSSSVFSGLFLFLFFAYGIILYFCFIKYASFSFFFNTLIKQNSTKYTFLSLESGLFSSAFLTWFLVLVSFLFVFGFLYFFDFFLILSNFF